MKTKLLIALGILFFPTMCFAKNIEINRHIYNVSDTLELDGIKYDANTDTLILNNANLEMIRTNNDLNIILEGNNYISNNLSSISGIQAKKISITGLGTLNINVGRMAIMGEKITLKNTNLIINTPNNASISSTSENNYDMEIINSNIKIINSEYVLNNFQGDIYIQNSNIEVDNCKCFISIAKEIFVENSNINIHETISFKFTSCNVFIKGNSNYYIYSKENSFNNSNYILSDNLNMMVSNDNLNYYESTDEINKYIMIFNYINNNNELEEYKEYLNNYEQELIKKEEKLIEEKSFLDNEKENIMRKEQELLEKENNLREDENKNNLELERIEKEKMKQEEEKINIENQYLNLRNSIVIEKEEIDKLKKSLELRELNLKAKENHLINLIEAYDDTNNSDEAGVEEEKTNYGEVLEDDLLEDNYQVIKHDSSIIKNSKFEKIFAPIISFFGGIATYVFTRRKIYNG